MAAQTDTPPPQCPKPTPSHHTRRSGGRGPGLPGGHLGLGRGDGLVLLVLERGRGRLGRGGRRPGTEQQKTAPPAARTLRHGCRGGGGAAGPCRVGGPGTAGRRVRFLRPPPGVHFPLEARVALSPPENDPTGTFPFRTSHPHHNGRKDYENGTNRTAMQRSRLAIPAVAQSKDKNHMARIIKRPRADVEVSWG